MEKGLFSVADTTDKTLMFILGVDVFFLALIVVLMLFFVFKYSRTKNKAPAQIEGSWALEIIWTIIPTIIVMVMFYVGWKGYITGRTIPDDSMVVKTTARKWSWSFEYPNGKISDTLYVPVDKPIKIELHSADVVHNFFAPAFKVKMDAMPGRTNTLWFQSRREGRFDVLCAEYCGTMHSIMRTKIVAVSTDRFASWIKEDLILAEGAVGDDGKPKVLTQEDKIKLGIRTFRRLCASCHTLNGKKAVGPTFQDLWDREEIVITDGSERTIKVDEEYLKRSVREPQADVVKGFEKVPMAALPVSEKELEYLIEYFKTL